MLAVSEIPLKPGVYGGHKAARGIISKYQPPGGGLATLEFPVRLLHVRKVLALHTRATSESYGSQVRSVLRSSSLLQRSFKPKQIYPLLSTSNLQSGSMEFPFRRDTYRGRETLCNLAVSILIGASEVFDLKPTSAFPAGFVESVGWQPSRNYSTDT